MDESNEKDKYRPPNKVSDKQLIHMIYTLLDLLNLPQVCLQLLNEDLYVVFLRLTFLCAQNDRIAAKDVLIRTMFVVTLQ